MTESTRRRGAIDVARSLALLTVVVGHLSMAVIDRDDSGRLRGANVFSLYPRWAWLTVLSPMPVFFVAAGYSNLGASLPAAVGRLRSLLGVAATVMVTWSTAVLVAALAVGGGSIIADGARLATQPLWFLAAYVPLTALSCIRGRLLSEHPWVAVAAALAVVASCDVARFAGDAPSWVGWPGFLAAWAVPWTVGSWWRRRDRDVGRMRSTEIRMGAALLAAGAVSAVLLVRHGGYVASMLDVGGTARSNSTPPTLYTCAVALAQAGAVLLCAGGLDRIGRRWRSLWSRAATASLGIYAWHLSAFALCAAAVAGGLPAPTRFTAAWWWSRVPWSLAVITVTMALVAATNVTLRHSSDAASDPTIGGRRIVAATLLAATAAAAVGLRGPRELPWAVAQSCGLSSAWLLLRSGRLGAVVPNHRS